MQCMKGRCRESTQRKWAEPALKRCLTGGGGFLLLSLHTAEGTRRLQQKRLLSMEIGGSDCHMLAGCQVHGGQT